MNRKSKILLHHHNHVMLYTIITVTKLMGSHLQILDSVQKCFGLWNFLTVDATKARRLLPEEL